MASTKKKGTTPSAAEELFHLGLGLASLAKDQLETISSALMKEGKLLAKDRKRFKKDLETKGQLLYQQMLREMEKTNRTVLKKMNIPSRKEFEALKRQVAGKRPTKR
ncbi:MAG: hypothetical protein UY76_C0008G0007 [Candidatus Uhrbacteria bacterium GW2011_GWA2_52_8d]|uniref:Uncharacterized protein n=1 Tax=Candidatus Uhrbacteria bacterium GW2011_GWA2_52_8d TaxID=1618979 RepID=A0A0G2AKL3_9BACT|nr:MAG: hypothetical protein UY76_C0008G0007 [Candidatus Uhrbacteria bacterium GW2011_GWA2_52_8d]